MMSVPAPILLLLEDPPFEMHLNVSEIKQVLANLSLVLPTCLVSDLVSSMTHWSENLGNVMDYRPALVYVKPLVNIVSAQLKSLIEFVSSKWHNVTSVACLVTLMLCKLPIHI
jgi:hypothetical protein